VRLPGSDRPSPYCPIPFDAHPRYPHLRHAALRYIRAMAMPTDMRPGALFGCDLTGLRNYDAVPLRLLCLLHAFAALYWREACLPWRTPLALPSYMRRIPDVNSFFHPALILHYYLLPYAEGRACAARGKALVRCPTSACGVLYCCGSLTRVGLLRREGMLAVYPLSQTLVR